MRRLAGGMVMVWRRLLLRNARHRCIACRRAGDILALEYNQGGQLKACTDDAESILIVAAASVMYGRHRAKMPAMRVCRPTAGILCAAHILICALLSGELRR